MNRQDSLTDQLKDVVKKANEMGCYDAADFINRKISLPKDCAGLAKRIVDNFEEHYLGLYDGFCKFDTDDVLIKYAEMWLSHGFSKTQVEGMLQDIYSALASEFRN